MVEVRYYDGDEVLKTESVYTGDKFTADYIPQIKGYTFNGWKTSDGKAFAEATVMGAFSLYADKTALSYEVTLDVNGGNELSKDTVTVTFDSNYSFPVPVREGYTFLGWYDEGTRLTDENGESVYSWSYDLDMTVTAKWEANKYTVTLNQNDIEAGTVIGSGEHAYDSEVTITVRTNDGYTWLGWYDESDELVSDKTTYTFKMGLDISYTAKWTYFTLTTACNDSSAGTVSNYSEDKVSAGEKVTLTAKTNNGYTFIGWYDGDVLLTNELNYTFTMPMENLSFVAKWSKVTITTNMSNAGTVTNLDGKYGLGDEVTITAQTKPGYTWIGWYDGEICLTSELSYTFNMPDKNMTYTAMWSKLTLSRNNILAGTISSLNSQYIVGQEVTITASTNEGYTWVGWYNDDKLLSSEAEYTFEMPSENITFTAKWIKVSLVNTNDDAGNLEKLLGKYKVGDQVSLKATENLGYVFDGWYENERKLSNSTEYLYTMPSVDTEINAKWSIREEMSNFEFSSTDSTCTINAVKDRTKTEIIIPDYVTRINGAAFENCNLLKSIKVPNSVTYIGIGAFKGCNSLVEIELPFTGCTLKHVGDSTAVASLPDAFGAIFGYIEVLSSSETPEGTTVQKSNYTHGNNTFYKCCYYIPQSLRKVTILDDLDDFNNCSMLTEVILGESVTYIGYEAFRNCSSLTSITIPDSVTSIESYAFSGCSSLTNITIPDSVTSIKSYAFENCALTSITIPDSVTSVGVAAFYGCPIETATMPSLAIENIPQEKLKTVIITSGESIGNSAFQNCGTLSSVSIGSGVTSIEGYAFENCSSLTNITIPGSVTSIGEYAFYGCSSLASITIPDSVTSIGNNAFEGCRALTSITIGNGVTSIASYAFRNCSLLTSITIPDSVTSIESYAFSGCDSLTNITIPDSVKSIGSSAFSGCGSLTSVSIGSGVTSIGDNVFNGCSSLESITAEENNVAYASQDGILYNKAKNQFIHIPKAIKGTIVIPDSVTSIKASAFYGRVSLTNITIPNSVTSIGDNAFEGCSSLESITVEENNVAYASQDGILYNKAKTEFIHIPKAIKGTIVIPDSMTSIGYRAFFGYTSFTNIIIPDSVTSIGEYAFYGCSSLASITIPDSVKSIGKSAFSDCSSLTSASIGNGVINIEEKVFYNCSSLTSVAIGNVQSIRYSAFENCISLADISFSGTKMQWGMITKYAKWTDNTGNYTIHCTDGDIPKN